MSTPTDQSWVTPSLDTLPQPREPYAVANARVNADPQFNAQLKLLLKHFDGVTEQRLRQQAGSVKGYTREQNPDGDMNETAMDCLRACIPPQLIPEGLQEKVEATSVVSKADTERKVADAAFKQRWAEYIQACQDRKVRHADARRLYEAEVAEAKARLDMVLNEPAPVTPKRDA